MTLPMRLRHGIVTSESGKQERVFSFFSFPPILETLIKIRECFIYKEALGCKGASFGGLILKLRQFALVIGNEGAIFLAVFGGGVMFAP